MMQNYARIADRFFPAGEQDPLDLQRHRAAIFQAALGLFLTLFFGGLYAKMGSPWSGASILLVSIGLALTPWALRRGVSRIQISNGMIGLTWLSTAIVTTRSGGFSSPALVWNFVFPICIYSVCGRRSTVVWSGLSGLQIGIFYGADALGVEFVNDFSSTGLALLRISGYLGDIVALVAVVFVVDQIRLASTQALERAERLLERERLVADIHDGVGSQIGALLALARDNKLPQPQLITDLEGCLDDLRLVVASLDHDDCSLEEVFGDLRARIQPRCDAAGIGLNWVVVSPPDLDWPPAVGLQLLRCAQEMLGNALRHARPGAIDLSFGASQAVPGRFELVVKDNGTGLASPPRVEGRGLSNLRGRARQLGGTFTLESTVPGAKATLQFPATLVRESDFGVGSSRPSHAR